MNNLTLLLLGVTAALGLYHVRNYLRATPNPTLRFVHGFLGFAALSALVVLLRGNPYAPEDPHPSHLGSIAAGLLAWSLFSGLIGPMYLEKSRRNREAILVSHAAAGLAGIAVVLLWISRQTQ